METIVSSSTLTWGFRPHPVLTPTPPRSFHATINRPPFIAVSQSKKLRIGLFGLSSSYFSTPSPTRKLSVSCDLKEITESEFSEVVLKSDLPVLVEFVASWCGPCRLIRSTMESIAQDYKEKLMVVKIDHDSNPKLIEEYKVYGLPSLIFFKNGQEVPESRREGAITKVKLKEYIDTLLESVSAV